MNGGHSSEINEISLADIERLASEADQINEMAERKPKPKRQRVPITDEPEPGEETELPPDPEFVFMVTHCVMGGVEKAKVKLNWSDPGLQWKEKVGATLARLAQRIRPMKPGPITDVCTLVGYVGLWGASNVLFSKENPNTARDGGKRENVQDGGIAQGGKTVFPV